MRMGLLIALLFIAGCKPSFDDRYEKAEKTIRDKAGAIDRELGKREREQREMESLASGAASPAPSPGQASPPAAR